jgi:hypothetical protein
MLVVAFFIPNPKKTKQKQKDKQRDNNYKQNKGKKLCTIIRACES